MLIVVVGLFLVCALSVGGHFFGVAYWIAAAIVAVVVLALAVSQLVARRRARMKQSAGLEREMMAQAEREASHANAVRQEEIRRLQKQVADAIGWLRKSKLGARGGAAALRALPWYVLIGPPGAGKTTAIRCSGLEFPVFNPKSPAVKGIGGTRNCDWWFTSEAIFIDTAGRYAIETDDGREWHTFLALLKKYRSDRPINGVVVAVSVTDLIGSEPEVRESAAKRLRARIDEVTTHLGVRAPVYVVFTKLDLVAGFVELWGSLTKGERGRVWGMSFSAASSEGARAAFEREFNLLADALHGRAASRLARERSPAVRRAVYQFPREFARLRDDLATFIHVLFAPNVFTESPLCRGAYFTSGTQEGRPVARVLDALGRVLELPAHALAVPNTPLTESKSYFVTDVFRRVMVPDKDLALPTAAAARNVMTSRVAIAAFGLSLAAILVVPGAWTFRNNWDEVGRVEAAAARVESRGVKWSDSGLLESQSAVMAELDDQLGDVEGAATENRYGWGMRTVHRMVEPLRHLFAATVAKALIAPALAATEGPGDDLGHFARTYDELRTYLVATEAPGEAGSCMEALDRAEAASQLITRRGAAPNPSVRPALLESLRPVVERYLALRVAGAAPALKRSDERVSALRAELRAEQPADRLYRRVYEQATIAGEAQLRAPSLSLVSQVRMSKDALVSAKRGVEIPAAFTKDGRTRANDVLERGRDDDPCVLAESNPVPTKELVAIVRRRYEGSYVEAWRAALRDLRFDVPGTRESIARELRDLVTPGGVFDRLFTLVEGHTTSDAARLQAAIPAPSAGSLLPVPTQVLAAGVALLDRSEVDQAFTFARPTGKDSVLDEYQRLVIPLTIVIEESESPDAILPQLQKTRGDVKALLEQLDQRERDIAQYLLLTPLDMAKMALGVEAGNVIEVEWQESVWSHWKADLWGRFPFDAPPSGPHLPDATMVPFIELLQPKTGFLDVFLDGLRTRPLGDGRHGVPGSPAFRDFIDRARKLQKTFFARPDKAEVRFQVQWHELPSDITAAELVIDGARTQYNNGPKKWVNFVWPGSGERGVSLRIRGSGGIGEAIVAESKSEFAFLHLLAAARLEPTGHGTIRATWRSAAAKGGSEVSVNLLPEGESPFEKELFAGFDCPERSGIGGR